jgi:hypothetical protein
LGGTRVNRASPLKLERQTLQAHGETRTTEMSVIDKLACTV